MNASQSERPEFARGNEPPAQALMGYMKWWSEERHCAGWLIDLHRVLARADDPAFDWLVEQAGGWWWWPENAQDVAFEPGSLDELRTRASAPSPHRG
jgi:hypothetical protein